MEKFIIRGYLNEDASKIGQYDFLAALTYQYKQDVKPENIFCAVSDNGDILGAVDLEPHKSWTQIDDDEADPNKEYGMCLNFRINPLYDCCELRQELLKAIINRAQEIKKRISQKVHQNYQIH